jgi:hypothetical protein
MDGAAFKQALSALGQTQKSFSHEYRLPIRTVQNWAKDGPPEHMAHILSVMIRQKIDPPPLPLDSDDAGMLDAARALDVTLRSVLLSATKAGWPKDVAVAGAIAWFSMQIANKN